MINDDEALVWMTSFEFLTNSKKEKLVELFDGHIGNIFKHFDKNSVQIKNIVGDSNYSKLAYACNEQFLKSYLCNLQSLDIKYITINSPHYPKRLRAVDEPPLVLFYRGDLSLLKTKSVAIVGTRKTTAYGKWCAEYFAKNLAENNLTIVSGLAFGTDTIAHVSTLAAYGKTIAVLPSGLSNIYPASNANLANDISKSGLLLSEYKPNYIPNNYDFPQRNRIIAGISDCVIITEAGEKSGTYHTLNHALKIGSEVFIVPGNINSRESIGSNRMLKSCQAAILLDYEQVLEHLGVSALDKKQIKQRQLSIEENLILSCLENGEKDFEYLKEKSQLDVKRLNSCLTNLQIKGIIKKLPGNTFILF